MSKRTQHIYYGSPLGWIGIAASKKGIFKVAFLEHVPPRPWSEDPLLKQCKRELDEYFTGQRKQFGVPLDFSEIDPAHRKIWEAILKIPYGKILSYAALADQLGENDEVLITDIVNNKNPLPVLIPNHRIVGSKSEIVDYAGGKERKRAMLEMESPQVQFQ